MKKFILIDHEPWTVRRKQLFYDMFEKAGLSLEVWDISQWLNPGFSNPDEIQSAPYLHKLFSYKGFKQLLSHKNASNTIIVVEVVSTFWENRRIFRALNKRNFISVKLELYGNTNIRPSRTDIVSLLRNIALKDIPHKISNLIKNRCFLKFYNRIFKIKPFSYILSSNSYDSPDYKINHPDYDNYMFEKTEKIIEGDYIVFCDVYFPYHSDIKFFYKLNRTIDGKKYQKIMKQYFDFLENKYKVPVVIAAHPKSNYHGDEFGNRRIIKYQTLNLMKYASMVTMHLCNTTSYALLGDKPIAYVATNDYLEFPSVKQKLCDLVEQTLGLKVYNIENVEDMKTFSFVKVEQEKREEYIFNYLTSKFTKNQPNYMLIGNILNSIKNR